LLDPAPVTMAAEDLFERRRAWGWTAKELARATVQVAAEVGQDLTLTQQAVSQFETGKVKSTPHWLRYAIAAMDARGLPEWDRAELLIERFGRHAVFGRAPAQLTGEVNWVTFRMPLPSEAALADMFEAQLQAFSGLTGGKLARALARRLPHSLARLQGALTAEPRGPSVAAAEGTEPNLGD
jgi:hypothetical protein